MIASAKPRSSMTSPETHIHDADALVVDAGQPLAPQIRPPALYGDDPEHGQNDDDDHAHAEQRKRLVERNRRPGQPAQHLSLLPVARRTPSAAGARLSGTRSRLIDDALEQLGIDRAIGRRRHGFARLRQCGIAGIVERRPRAARLCDPAVEIAGRHRLGDEPHLGEPVAAEIRRDAGILARPVRQEVEVRGHPGHRVDLAAELRDEERIHHRRRGEPKVDRRSGRDHQLIDGGDALIGVDEQPFPIERHDVDAGAAWHSRRSAPADRADGSRSMTPPNRITISAGIDQMTKSIALHTTRPARGWRGRWTTCTTRRTPRSPGSREPRPRA